MTSDQIQYEELAQDALRNVIRKVLTRVATSGLPGEHHFYISFDTKGVGVIVSKRLKEQYPEEMTIVLQHQFWDLQVLDHYFEVRLSFNNVPERLVVPFTAVKVFFDPSVPYGLQFGAAEAANDEGQPTTQLPGLINPKDDGVSVPTVFSDPQSQDAGNDQESEEEVDNQSADIVELDHFRKK